MSVQGDEDFRRLCFWLFFATRGGKTRLNIIRTIMLKPMNTNQLSLRLKLNYRTVEHHLNILFRNGFVEKVGDGYAETFFPSRTAEGNIKCLEELEARYGERA